MWKSNTKKQLEDALTVSLQYESSLENLKCAEEAVQAAQDFIPSKLSTFDEENREQYIHNLSGDEPKQLSKWNPLNHTKKKKEEMRIAVEDYNQRLAQATAQYYEEYKDTRLQLEAEDKNDKEQALKDAEALLESATGAKDKAEIAWKANTLLSEKMRNSYVIKRLIDYFEDGRVDSLKEAINLYYDDIYKERESKLAEEHRQKLEQIINEQNDSIQHAISVAEDARSTASEALEAANDAMDRADEAYYRAGSLSSSSSDDDY